MKRTRSIPIRQIGFFAVQIVITLVIAEVFCRYWIPRYGDGLQRARQILEPDSELGWRQRKHLETRFENKTVTTDADGFRVSTSSQLPISMLVLGPSSAFGWGVGDAESYSALLSERLSGKGTRVFNASVIGFSSHQGRLVLESLKADKRFHNVRHVIIAYGINDLDRFRFFDSETTTDEEFFKERQKTSIFAHWWSSMALTELLYRGYQELKVWSNCGVEKMPERRVSWASLEANVRTLIAQSAALGAQAVLVNTTFYPNVKEPTREAALSDEYYTKSIEAHRARDCSNARRWFQKAKHHEVGRIAVDVATLNTLFKKIADDTGVRYVDITPLERGDAHKNYVDPVHPSGEGHKIIAELIWSALSQ